jgi:hypothetical protein
MIFSVPQSQRKTQRGEPPDVDCTRLIATSLPNR